MRLTNPCVLRQETAFGEMFVAVMISLAVGWTLLLPH
jgi:hypothetical protein